MRKRLLLTLIVAVGWPLTASATIYYVRQTIGDDAHDGTSPQTAWQHVSKLSTAMHAGDTAYVGPGLYRDSVEIANDGTAENRITLIADTTGRYTGDPPGVVMLTGAVPIDETIFAPGPNPGVYVAKFPTPRVIGVVEMDGDQYRYSKAVQTREYHVDKMTAVDVVAKYPSSFFYDDATKLLYIHTSDGKAPTSHEIELIRALSGISVVGGHYVTVFGFTFRHFDDDGVFILERGGDTGNPANAVESSDCMVIGNTSYGSHMGIRVYKSTNIVVSGNTAFRNENSGVYFLKDSLNGKAVGNTVYENLRGVRWGSASNNGLIADNLTFDNQESGIVVGEEVRAAVVTRNRLVNNKKYQLLVENAGEYASEDNCFVNGGEGQVTAYFFPLLLPAPKTLAEYQQAKHQDLSSREGDCGNLPAKLDVHKLHAETMAYAERARKILSGPVKSEKATGEAGSAGATEGERTPAPRGWLEWLLGR